MLGISGQVAILYVISITGLIANTWACRTVYVTKYMHNAFGVFCIFLSISNFVVMLIFFVWTALPMNNFIGNEVYSELPGKIVGHVALFCLYGCEYSHIVISFNRLVHIAFPLYGWRFFTKKMTSFIVSIVIISCFIEIAPYFSTEQCYFTYDVNTSLWNFADNDCGRFCAFYFDFIPTSVILCVIFVMDVTAFVLFHRHRLNHISNSEKNRSIEKRLFMQSICQVIPIFIAIITNHIFAFSQGASDWVLFLAITVTWGMVHMLDGVVLVAFHSKVLARIGYKLGLNSSATLASRAA